MRVRRRARAEVEAQKALAVAAAHANAGLRAQLAGEPPAWSPPGLMPLAVDAPPAPVPDWPPPAPPAPAPAPPVAPDLQGEFLRVLEVVTRMCDHVIEYIEADRAERRVLVETLGQIARAISVSTAANGIANGAVNGHAPVAPRERVIGGSMPAGPDRHIDLTLPEPATTAVEVRCRFGEGERWVDGFEIVDIEHREDGPHYRLRRQRDGAILPQLFDAANIRHVETFEELTADQPASWSRL